MANQKVTALTEDTDPTSDDLVYVVNAPGGTPGSRKVALSNIHKGALSGVSLTAATVAATDKILGQDADDSDNLKTFTASSIGNAATAWAATSHTHTASQISDSTADGRAILTSADANPFTDAQQTKLASVSTGADVTADNVETAIEGVSLSAITGATSDQVLVRDASASNGLAYVLWENLPSGGGGGGQDWSDPVDADIIPDGDGTRDLGSAAVRFAQAHIDNLFALQADSTPTAITHGSAGALNLASVTGDTVQVTVNANITSMTPPSTDPSSGFLRYIFVELIQGSGGGSTVTNLDSDASVTLLGTALFLGSTAGSRTSFVLQGDSAGNWLLYGDPTIRTAQLPSTVLYTTDIASGTITARADDIDLSGGSDGDVLTVQADGSLAIEAPAASWSTAVNANVTFAADSTYSVGADATRPTVIYTDAIVADLADAKPTAIVHSSAGALDLSAVVSTFVVVTVDDDITEVTPPSGDPAANFVRSILVRLVQGSGGSATFTGIAGNADVTLQGQHPVLGATAGNSCEFILEGDENGAWTAVGLPDLYVTQFNSGTDASSSTFLRGDGTWVTPAGSGDVSAQGTPVNGQIGVWTSSTGLEGDAALTFDDSDDTLVIGASGKVAFGAVDILSDSSGTTSLLNIDALDATTIATIIAAIKVPFAMQIPPTDISGGDGDYLFFSDVPFAATITQVTDVTLDTGTATFTLKINTTAVGGISVSASTTPSADDPATGDNVTSDGDSLSFNINGATGSPTTCKFVIHGFKPLVAV